MPAHVLPAVCQLAGNRRKYVTVFIETLQMGIMSLRESGLKADSAQPQLLKYLGRVVEKFNCK